MNPYDALPFQNFWKASAQTGNLLNADFDHGYKFTFTSGDIFAIAGSCFAQHIGKHLIQRGGNVLFSERRHPLFPKELEHGYELFSARYGNIYTARQLLELLEQALGKRRTIKEWGLRGDGRIVDMLRPRAAPRGFPNTTDAEADRDYHLHAVNNMLQQMTVFVFTLGLTETWLNAIDGYCYPVVPGAIAGTFSPNLHIFKNFNVREVIDDLRKVIELIHQVNCNAHILFTISPVGLVATAEQRSVMVSTIASKSILRAAVDTVLKEYEFVDYFPSYEIITGPLGRGRFWEKDGRSVTKEGVETVMNIFFQSRMSGLNSASINLDQQNPVDASQIDNDLQQLLNTECDEVFLDPSHRWKLLSPSSNESL
jgi:hypothetical protein